MARAHGGAEQLAYFFTRPAEAVISITPLFNGLAFCWMSCRIFKRELLDFVESV